MVDLQTAEKALKSVYLSVVTDELNISSNPLLSKIEQTSSDVWGKDVVKLVSYGINGGIGAGTEIGSLPIAAGNNYAQFRTELKNLYGTIEISDKAIRASQNSNGAFVNLLNAEMEGLLKASKYNLSRMLYGDGSGKLSDITIAITNNNNVTVNNVKNFIEGLVVDIYSGEQKIHSAVKVVSVDRRNNNITFNKTFESLAAKTYITIQNSKGLELTGLGSIFSDKDIYGLPREGNSWLEPYSYNVDCSLDVFFMQEAIDYIDEISGNTVDFITCAYDVRKSYVSLLSTNRFNIDYMNLDGGFKAINYSGIPMVADKFIKSGEMYMLNTNDFKMHQLCDWRWLEGEGGKVIKQKSNSASYTATLVKYADIICSKPCGQAKLFNIK